jgi:putative membrane protein
MGALVMIFADGRWNNGRYGMHDGDGFGWVMLVLMFVFVAAVVVAVVALLRGATPLAPGRGSAGGGRGPDARTILHERFARGEIEEDDYRARMRALDETGG